MFLEALQLDINITRAASMLGASRKHLSKCVNENVDCSPEMARRLARARDVLSHWLTSAIGTKENLFARRSVARNPYKTATFGTLKICTRS